MKTKKRFLSILISLMMVLGLMQGMSLTAYADDDPPYAQYKNTTTEITFDGKSWYLIDYDASTVTLLAKECVGASAYNSSVPFVEYRHSTVKTAVDNWYNSNITADAQTAVSGDAMFLLTTSQASTIYSANPDVLKCSWASGADSNAWWLCSPCFSSNVSAAVVNGDDGNVFANGAHVQDNTLGVRPALQLNLSKVVFDSATKTFSLATPYPLWVGGTQVTSAQSSGQGWEYDDNTKILTLNGYNYSGEGYYNVGIYAEQGLTISIKEENNITSNQGSGISVNNGELKIMGSGVLNVISQNHDIYISNGLTVNGGTVNCKSRGIYAGMNSAVTINGGTVITNGGEMCSGIYAVNVTVNGGNVNATGTYGIESEYIEVKGGEVTANGQDRGLFSDGNLIISGGKVTANGQSCIYASKEFAISGGTVTAIGTANATPNLGIVSEYGAVTITDGTVSAKGSKNGIWAKNGVTINGGATTAIGGNKAIYGALKNAIAGTGWTDTAGAEGKANIVISTEGRELTYMKVQFPGLPVASVTTAPASKDLTYNGSAQTLVTAGTATGGTMHYALGTEAEATEPYTASIPTATDPGTYYVWYKVEGDDNHTDTEPDKVKVTISPTDKTGLNAAIAEAETYYNSIKNDYADIAATLKTAIEAAKAVAGNDNTTESAVADAITALNGAVDAAKADAKKADEKKAADEAAAKKVVDRINALPANAGVGDKDAVTAARAAYDALTDDQKKLVFGDVLAELTTAEAQVQAAEEEAAKQAEAEKEAEAKKAADEAAAKKVVDAINALPENAGVGDKDAVTAARAAYDALTDDQKKLVSGDVLAKLTTAEAQVQAAEEEAAKQAEDEKEAEEKQAADEAAANGVIALINALPANAGVGDEDAVTAARAAYDALTDDQKALVPADVLAKLTTAEAQVQAAEEAAKKINISKCTITVKDLTYTGKAVTAKAMKAAVTVKHGKKTLKAGTDYTLTYDKALKAVGPAAVTVVGKGNYKGSKEMDFNIIPKGTAFTKMTGGQQQITLKWKNPGNVTGYQIEYSLKKDFKSSEKVSIDKAKTLTTTIEKLAAGKTYYVRIRTCKTVSKKNYFSDWSKADTVKTAAEQVNIGKCKITVKNLTYTGKPVTAKAMKAAVTVKHGKKTLKAGTDYTLTYDKALKAVGPAAVTVVGKGNYSGSKKVTFNIIPWGTAFTQRKGGKQSITLKWRNPGNITGYQIEYSLKKDFKSSEKVNIEKAKTLKTTIGGLKAKTTYYVRIRTYKTVGKKNYYSAWSKAETVKTASGKGKNEADVQNIEIDMNAGEALDLKPLLPVGDVELPGETEIEMAG